MVEAIVNHISGAAKAGVAGNSNKALYIQERKAALELWGAHLMGLVERHLMTLQSAAPKTPMTSTPNRSSVTRGGAHDEFRQVSEGLLTCQRGSEDASS